MVLAMGMGMVIMVMAVMSAITSKFSIRENFPLLNVSIVLKVHQSLGNNNRLLPNLTRHHCGTMVMVMVTVTVVVKGMEIGMGIGLEIEMAKRRGGVGMEMVTGNSLRQLLPFWASPHIRFH